MSKILDSIVIQVSQKIRGKEAPERIIVGYTQENNETNTMGFYLEDMSQEELSAYNLLKNKAQIVIDNI